MSKKEAIRNAVSAVTAHGISLPADIEKQIASLDDPQYHVAVVGDYQVGKSTLINRVFLGDKPLLTEGHGLCTTAVATDLEYGPSPKLEVYEWSDESRTAENLVKTVDDPAADDVDDATVSSSMDTRADLAKKIARVLVQVPNDALKGFTVTDTPGLNDSNKELLDNTTWRIIPSADLAILVVEGDRELGDRQLNLLRKEIMGRNGIARIMILISYKPRFGYDAKLRRKVLDDIQAQLVKIGRDNITVEMYCFDSSIEDVMSDISEIRLTIRQFLTDNALPGREEKIANLLRIELAKDIVEIAAKLKTAGASEAERAALAAKVDAEVARFKEQAELAFEGFRNEVKSLGDDMKHEVDLAVEAVFDRFLADLASQSTVDAMKTLLENAGKTLKSDLQDKISIIGLKLKSDINSIVARYGKDMEDAGRRWNVFLSDELNVKTGIVAKIPTIVYDVINVIALNIILPGGWIIAIIANLLGKKVFNPTTWVAKKIIVSQVKRGLEEAKPEVRTQIMQQIDEGIQKTFADVKVAMEAFNKAQVEAIRSVLAAEPTGSGDRAALESAKVDLEKVIETL